MLHFGSSTLDFVTLTPYFTLTEIIYSILDIIKLFELLKPVIIISNQAN